MNALSSLRLGSTGSRWKPILWAMRTDQQFLPLRTISSSFLVMSSDATAASPVTTSAVATEPKKKLSMAMKFYLEKKREHDAFIAHERSEFELGKKHLANMMGMEAEAMTQEDIDKAIDYLFPSGLFHPEARPVMKPPEDVSMTISIIKN
jgi:hypothetical protein